MPGLFGLYGLGGRSLTTFQTAMNAVAHNVANSATPGFHRQRIDLEAGLPELTGFGALGTGVRIDTIRRVQDRFLETALQREAPLLSRFQARADALARSETAFGEPSDGGLTTLLDNFFDGWDDLASAPEDLGARESVVRLGAALCDSLANASVRLAEEQRSLTGEIARTVDDANRVIRELQRLNRAIVASSPGGVPAPDLEDRRDALARVLAELVGATSTVEDDGTATVRLGGRALVQNESADEVTFDAARPQALTLQGSDLDAAEIGGQLGGLVDARDTDLAESMRRLDRIAVRLAADVNALHHAGRDRRGEGAGPFFVFEGLGADGVTGAAAALRVDSALRSDASRVAAGASGTAGDNGVALDLAALRSDSDGVASDLRALVVDLGARARESRDLASGQRIVVDSYEAQRESVSGVSLDEEAANLLRFQRSYQAAARLVTTIDEMAQSLLAM